MDIPVIEDLNSNEGTEFFIVHLSLRSRTFLSTPTNDDFVRLGNVPQAKVFIQDEIILNFLGRSIEVEEGENLILNVTVNTAKDQNFNITVNVTGNNAHCKFMHNSNNEGKLYIPQAHRLILLF